MEQAETSWWHSALGWAWWALPRIRFMFRPPIDGLAASLSVSAAVLFIPRDLRAQGGWVHIQESSTHSPEGRAIRL